MSDYLGGSITYGRGSLTDSIDTGGPADDGVYSRDLGGGRCLRMRRQTAE
jgi:hypothetical protein